MFLMELSEEDIPSAVIEPENASVSQLKWWLLCRGFESPSSWKKAKLIERHINFLELTLPLLIVYRVKSLKKEGAKVIDVDGSYLYRKDSQAIMNKIPLIGWETVDDTLL